MNNTIAMIPAAGRGSRMLSLTEDMPKAMLPLHNKPIIGWHLDKLLKEDITKVCIIVGYKKEKLISYVNKFYSNKMDITYVEQKELLGLAHAIKQGTEKIKKEYKNHNLFIILGDTIIKDDLNNIINKHDNFIGYKNVKDYKRWCLIQDNEDNEVMNFIDKPDNDPGVRKAVIGVYYFNNISLLDNCINQIIKNDITIKGEYQLSSAMEEYIKENPIKTVKFKEWYDCGEVETFNKIRKNITRHFNSIEVTNDNTIIKKSEKNKKIKNEIIWYLNLPNKLRVYTPQLIDYSILSDNTFYELEYINFTPMQELFIYNLPDLPEWDKFFKRVFNMIERFNLYSTKARFNSIEHSKKMLINKTDKRINSLLNTDPNSDYWKDILSNDGIKINNKLYKNWPLLKEYVYDYIKKDILPDSPKYWQIIHGDLFFGNMLYDTNSKTLKVIDPRGSFGLNGIYGDIRYDIAKLNHSICGKYDFIINQLYVLNEKEKEFEYIMYDNPRHNKINKMFKSYIEEYNYDYKQIMIMTGLLFLSMIPLHKNKFNNQKMFYLTAIEIFNEIF
jgi:NDP-sugar pyrophosphorylase family protein